MVTQMNSAKKKVIGISLVTAAAVLGDSMLFIVLPLYYQDFGLTSLWQVGVLLSINRFVRLPINPLVGWFYSKFELRKGVIIAVVLAVCTTLSYGLAQHFLVLVGMRMLWGVAWSLLRLGGMLTVVEVSTKENKGRLMGLYNGLWGIGGLIGMLVGGLFVDIWSIVGVTIVFALINVAMLPTVYFLVPVNSEQKLRKKQRSNTKWFTQKTLLVFVTGTIVGFAVFGLFASTLSMLVEKALIDHLQIAGMVIGGATIAGIMQAVRWGWDPFLAPFLGKVLDQSKQPDYLILVPLFGMSFFFLLFQTSPSIHVLIIFILVFQFFSTFMVTATDALAAHAAVKNPVAVMTVYTVVLDLGAALGPLASFLVIDWYGLSTVYMMAAILMAVVGGSWILYNIIEKKKAVL
ncbi:MFS transporter [Bacillus sp. JCM 19041]|uniref:MFS transporter n=1 Tax=Bacillus sp. JCM 19041 TaxID=1460637 RepID=UPI000A45D485